MTSRDFELLRDDAAQEIENVYDDVNQSPTLNKLPWLKLKACSSMHTAAAFEAMLRQPDRSFVSGDDAIDEAIQMLRNLQEKGLHVMMEFSLTIRTCRLRRTEGGAS